MPTPRPNSDLAELLPSWELALRAERKSPATLRVYVGGARHFLGWCQQTGTPAALDRATVTAYIADLLDHGAEGNSAKIRQQALRRFAAWLVEEGELDADPLAGLRPPRVDNKVTPVLSGQQLRALLAACQGPTFTHRRDEALVRLMAETGLRAGETVALTVADVDVRAGTALVRRGKGGKGRMVPFGPQTARALDRYLRLRRSHRLATTPALWLGARNKTLGYSGLHQALGIRAAQAGIVGFHPHVLRHTAEHRWLAAGGTEGRLMAVAGWSRRDMLDQPPPGQPGPVLALTLRNLAAARELGGRVQWANRHHHEALARCAEDGHGEVAVRDAAVVAKRALPRPRPPSPS